MSYRRQLGTDEVVPNLHIRPQFLGEICGLCASNHGPQDHLITQCLVGLTQIHYIIQLSYLIRAVRSVLNLVEGFDGHRVISHLPLSDGST